MNKSMVWFAGMLFAFSSAVAMADHGNPMARGMSMSPGHDGDEDGDFLSFGSMVGVDGSFVGSDSIRGVVGAALPWAVGRARGSLSANGHLRINVRGLVLPNDPAVPANLRGTNPDATFRGLVSCLTEQSGGGGVTTVNVATGQFPASPTGNSEINGTVALPAQCIAPIVFVMSGTQDVWFAVAGKETTTP